MRIYLRAAAIAVAAVTTRIRKREEVISVNAWEESVPDPTLTYRGVAYPWHCDHMGHMNVMWYVGKFDEATWQLLAMLGITGSYMRDRRLGMVAVEQKIVYKRELVPRDLVMIRSGILEIKEKVIRFFHEMVNEGSDEIAAVTVLTGVPIDAETRKARPFPGDILERGRKMLVEYDPGL